MIPVIEHEVVDKRKWIDGDEFSDILTISQSAPGLLAVNISIFIGYKLRGKSGSVIATLGSILPSFIAILLIAMFFSKIKDNPVVESIFKGMRPVVVALILVPMINLAKREKLSLYTVLVGILSLFLITYLKVSPIYILLTVGIYSVIKGRFLLKDGGKR